MDTTRILTALYAERELINQSISALEALGGTAASLGTTPKTLKKAARAHQPTTKKRVISPESRMRMAEAQQKRWAKKKRAAKAAAKKASATPVTTTSAKEALKV